ncbi:hypothetical protein pclt_cds_327 [Pandoravirus celtis]|uniref:Uncharacterized protein n=1 Tax=Pandoravirus celtis TaxID=2568002 RepID=A0A4D6EGM0_9VIRU|nr:hypothetical protein pclt_cds_327 [Pandoravirus celtis]
MEAGNGEGRTRYMLWQDVLTMPPVYAAGYDDGEFSDNAAYHHKHERDMARRARRADLQDAPIAGSPCGAIMAEIERILADGLRDRRRAHHLASPHSPIRFPVWHIVPSWLPDVEAKLKL